MKSLVEYINSKMIRESSKEVSVMPDLEGYIGDKKLKFLKPFESKLLEYFSDSVPVHIYNEENWDDALKWLVKEKTDNILDELSNNDTTIKLYKYNSSHFAIIVNDGKTYLMLDGELKL